MEEIIPLADAYNKKEDKATEKKIEEHKRLIAECNEKLKDYRLELNALPDEIKAVNKKLMFATMDLCYRQLNENTASIAAAEEWIRDTRIKTAYPETGNGAEKSGAVFLYAFHFRSGCHQSV